MAKLYQDQRLIGESSEDELLLEAYDEDVWCGKQLLFLVVSKNYYVSRSSISGDTRSPGSGRSW